MCLTHKYCKHLNSGQIVVTETEIPERDYYISWALHRHQELDNKAPFSEKNQK